MKLTSTQSTKEDFHRHICDLRRAGQCHSTHTDGDLQARNEDYSWRRERYSNHTGRLEKILEMGERGNLVANGRLILWPLQISYQVGSVAESTQSLNDSDRKKRDTSRHMEPHSPASTCWESSRRLHSRKVENDSTLQRQFQLVQ